MPKKIRWGILGTGHIAHEFATALNAMADAEIAAVGSRTAQSANTFADQFAIPRRHPTYEELARDPGIDIVYIATPNHLHKPNTILCLESGKAVLCEKPFTINQHEAEQVLAVAQKQNLFLMEAMWTRFIPAIQHALRWIESGKIGNVQMVQAAFGFREDPANGGALFDPAMGGGSLLDVGIYPITLAHLAFGGLPREVTGSATIGPHGVDEQAAVIMKFDNSGLAVLSSAITTDTPYDAWILGSEGKIHIHETFWNASTISLHRENQEPEIHTRALDCNGYEYEAAECHRCLREGALQSNIMPHQTTLDILGIMDTLRAQWGMRYPMDPPPVAARD